MPFKKTKLDAEFIEGKLQSMLWEGSCEKGHMKQTFPDATHSYTACDRIKGQEGQFVVVCYGTAEDKKYKSVKEVMKGAVQAAAHDVFDKATIYFQTALDINKAEKVFFGGKEVSKDIARLTLFAAAKKDGVDLSKAEDFKKIGEAINSSKLFAGALTAAYENNNMSEKEANVLANVSRDGKISKKEDEQLTEFIKNVKKPGWEKK